MWRAGYSWPTRDGGRAWVSGPLWGFLLWRGGGLVYWTLVGWWLWLLIATALAGAWLTVQTFLIFVSAVVSAYALWLLWQHRPVVLYWQTMKYGLIILRIVTA